MSQQEQQFDSYDEFDGLDFDISDIDSNLDFFPNRFYYNGGHRARNQG